MDAATPVQPYCGAPPDPGEIWTRWRLDPLVLALLAAVWICYLAGCWRARRRGVGPARAQRTLFHLGWLTASFALVSPLCALSVSLFAARAVQHVLLTLLAAPLIAAAAPWRALGAALGVAGGTRLAALRAQPLPASAAFAFVLWVWQMPGPYAATFASVAVYWAMHLSLFGAALWLWTCLLDGDRRALVGNLFASIAAAIQMGLLGALITLSPRPFYVPHFLTTQAWGYSPLQDQQLGGVVMWVVGGTVFFAIAMFGLARMFAERQVRPAAPALRAAGPSRAPRAVQG